MRAGGDMCQCVSGDRFLDTENVSRNLSPLTHGGACKCAKEPVPGDTLVTHLGCCKLGHHR